MVPLARMSRARIMVRAMARMTPIGLSAACTEAASIAAPGKPRRIQRPNGWQIARDDREAHHDQAQDHCGPASHPVGIGPDHNASDWPGKEPSSERSTAEPAET